MSKLLCRLAVLCNLLIVCTPYCLAETVQGEGSAIASPEPEATSRIDPFVDLLIRQASDYLSLTDSLMVHTESTVEEVLTSGQKLQLSRSANVLVRQPDRLRVEVTSDRGVTRYYYDGKTMSRFDLEDNVYARIDVPETIEAALDHAMERFRIDAPLADFFAGDLYDNLLGNAESAFYAGLHYLEGEKYHHLALSNGNVNYQVWIAEGTAPLIRKVAITYKHLEGSPQFIAMLSGWDFDPLAPDMLFDFYPPVDADRIEYLPVATPAGEVKQ